MIQIKKEKWDKTTKIKKPSTPTLLRRQFKKKTVITVRNNGKLITYTDKKIRLTTAKKKFKRDNTFIDGAKGHHLNKLGRPTVLDIDASKFKQQKGRKNYLIVSKIERRDGKIEVLTSVAKGKTIKQAREKAEKRMYTFIAGIYDVENSDPKVAKKLYSKKIKKRRDIIRVFKGKK